MKTNISDLRVDIHNCQRCSGDHEDLVAFELTNPIIIPNTNGKEINYWASCPTLDEPILIHVEVVDD